MWPSSFPLRVAGGASFLSLTGLEVEEATPVHGIEEEATPVHGDRGEPPLGCVDRYCGEPPLGCVEPLLEATTFGLCNLFFGGHRLWVV